MRAFPLFLIFFFSCTIHYTHLSRKFNRETAFDSTTLVRPVVKIQFHRISEAKKINFNSDIIYHKIYNVSDIVLHKYANIKIIFSTRTIKVNPSTSIIPWIFTFGIFPAYGKETTLATFKVMSRDTGDLVKEYIYTGSDYHFTSWLSIPFSIVLAPLFSSFHSSSLNDTPEPGIYLMNRFFNDFKKDMNNTAFLHKIESVNHEWHPKVLFALPMADHEFMDETVRSSIRTQLIEKSRVLGLQGEKIDTALLDDSKAYTLEELKEYAKSSGQDRVISIRLKEANNITPVNPNSAFPQESTMKRIYYEVSILNIPQGKEDSNFDGFIYHFDVKNLASLLSNQILMQLATNQSF